MSQAADVLKLVRTEVSRLWQRRWIVAGVAWGVCLAGAVAVSFVDDRYEASARVFVDTQTVLKPLMAGLAFQPDIDQQVKMLARTLISRPNVEHLLTSQSVGLEQPGPERMDRAVEELKSKIKFDAAGNGVFALSYKDSDPQRARRLVDNLLNLFMTSGTNAKQRDSEEASRFIDEQIKSYESKLSESENRLKDFKLRNFGVTGAGGQGQDYYARTSALTEVVSKLQLDLKAAEQSRDALRKELASEDPQLPADSMPGAAVPVVSELDQRLEAQRRQLDDLLRRYTDEHPDVLAVRRTIAQLESQRRADADQRAKAKHAQGSAATNPVFQKLRVSLAEAEANVASLRSQLSVQQGRLDQARAQATRVPQVEAELAQLNRDYDIIRKNYEALVSRREAASLGVKIDQSASMAEFRLIEPPQVNSSPVFPSRKMLAAAVLPLSVLVGIVVALMLGRMASTVDDEAQLRELVKRPVLGTLSLVVTDVAREQLRRARMVFGSAMAGLVFVNVGWVLWMVIGGRP